MRFDTLYASAYLSYRMKYSPHVKHILDDGDLILVHLNSGEEIIIYMIERPIPLSDIQYYYRTNTAQGVYTLLLFRADLLLPEHNDLYMLDAWMSALLSLQNNQIYGFEVAAQQAWFFPAHFEGSGYQRKVRYGNVVNYTGLNCRMVASDSPHLTGTWRVASFGVPVYNQRRSYRQSQSYRSNGVNTEDATPLSFYFHELKVSDGATMGEVKQAYRALAREFHPDLNASVESHIRMKQINEAYMRVVQYLRDQEERA